jgi:hypothetical protein
MGMSDVALRWPPKSPILGDLGGRKNL